MRATQAATLSQTFTFSLALPPDSQAAGFGATRVRCSTCLFTPIPPTDILQRGSSFIQQSLLQHLGIPAPQLGLHKLQLYLGSACIAGQVLPRPADLCDHLHCTMLRQGSSGRLTQRLGGGSATSQSQTAGIGQRLTVSRRLNKCAYFLFQHDHLADCSRLCRVLAQLLSWTCTTFGTLAFRRADATSAGITSARRRQQAVEAGLLRRARKVKYHA